MSGSEHTIFVIEDHPDIRQLIKVHLQIQGHHVETAESIFKAKEYLKDHEVSLIIMDRMLEDGNAIELCKELRQDPQYNNLPIIMATAMTDPEEIIKGLEAGADDYITKPFDLNILNARVNACLRRSQKIDEKQKTLEFKDFIIHYDKCEIKISDRPISLTHTEFQIIKTLSLRPGIVYSRKDLIQEVLGDQVFVTNRTIDTHIAGLRKKLKHHASLIETVRAIGYRFSDISS